MIFGKKFTRIEVLEGFASADVTGNRGDRIEVATAFAEELISAGRAKLTDAPLGAAPTRPLEFCCWSCSGRYGYFTGRCPYCAAPQVQ